MTREFFEEINEKTKEKRIKNHYYTIGIDLGTSNCVLGYADSKHNVKILEIPQLSEEKQIEVCFTLPSCCYIATKEEIKKNVFAALPFYTENTYGVGKIAEKKVISAPDRVILSAKSWLSNSDVDRTAPILPWKSQGLTSQEKISPLEASVRYLKYLKDVWNYLKPETNFEEQSIIITVPASFDEVAQQLTLEAAFQAGYPKNIRLLEEPQAAFYYWLMQGDKLEKTIKNILVCDVGGGTTDLSLFHVRTDNSIERVAVSEHILLGGDNFDLAIARLLEKKFNSIENKLDQKQWYELVYQARLLKEKILHNNTSLEQEFYVSISNQGSNLFSNSRTVSITGIELLDILEQGFFPICQKDEEPFKANLGLREFGLKYEIDSALTRHIAKFLAGRKVEAVLFNGGTLKAVRFKKRLLELLAIWQDREVVELENREMDLAVAYGAAYYGQVLNKKNDKIYAGYPRSIFIELEGEKLLCVLAKGMTEGEQVIISDHVFKLLVNKPVCFKLYTSRETYKLGTIIQNKEDVVEIKELPVLQTIIKIEKNNERSIDIILEAKLTETGIFEIYCIDLDGKELSKLAFNIKFENKVTKNNSSKVVDYEQVEDAKIKCANETILKYYGKGKNNIEENPKNLFRDLEKILQIPRQNWSLVLLRTFWEALSSGITRRNRSLVHECVWLNLAGYFLRPGYGADLDHIRIAQLWRLFELGLAFPKEFKAKIELAIMWRRVAGGLTREQQELIFEKFDLLKNAFQNPEFLRLAASLERLNLDLKIKLQEKIVSFLLKNQGQVQDEYFWAFGRIATRVPLYAGLDAVLPKNKIEIWLTQLLDLELNRQAAQALNNAISLASRLTLDAERDIDEVLREKLIKQMRANQASNNLILLLTNYQAEVDNGILFGEILPIGLKQA